ncbi:hypothetical protein RI129_003909 [Pyrocoelia pectoralis]|uniref:ubiquitinyl hydrolase 1 n=1 Tax=Pyrocoelia pectoralis TaxID=417401 RepID=A0AAN7VIN8_9COLE
MCDACSDFLQLLISYEANLCKEINEQPTLTRQDINTILLYVQTWASRQCMCCYRDQKNLERFSCITQGILYLTILHLKELGEPNSESDKNDERFNKEDHLNDIQERDKLFILASKIFLLNFPLYVAFKHTSTNKIDDLTQHEVQSFNSFCDLHDSEIPVYLLRNVTLFCKLGGLYAMTACFTFLPPSELPVSTAHAMISIVCNLKLWMNFKSTVSLLVPLRSCVLRYMCKLSDQDLRTPTIKGMADFMWNVIKDPLDTPMAFDIDGLDLAFKYFTSSTLTMRLAGITQINNQIGVLAELCVGETLPEAEAAPRHMADWLINNNIIVHIFGPNLHVEVIKQSHIILNFLAMQGRITCDHIDTIWAAAQLKHCSKTIHDLLPGLVKHLSAAPALHLYSLLFKMEPKDHTEQTLFLASALIKFIWTRGGAGIDAGLIGLAASAAGIALHKCQSSSENSVSMEPSSEEDHGDSSVQSDSHKSESEDIDGAELDEEMDEPPIVVDSEDPPCRVARKGLNLNDNKALCDGSSSEVEMEGDPLKVVPIRKTQASVLSNRIRGSKRQICQVRKKSDIAVLPNGVETVNSSSSHDEGDASCPFTRKRRKLLRKTRNKVFKGKKNKQPLNVENVEVLSEGDGDSEQDLKNATLKDASTLILASENNRLVEAGLKGTVYLEDSSSCSELSKDTHGLEGHDSTCVSSLLTIHPRASDHILELLSGEEAEAEGDADGSYSSRMSTKSEKNMADFDGEDSVCEEELAQLAEHAQLNLHTLANHSSPEKSPTHLDPKLSACFQIENVCQPGNTLLWDLVQDNKIGMLSEGLALEAEKTLCNLLCFNTDRIIRMKFIEGCLHNLANNVSVIVSLRLLPKLLTSFQQFRGLDMHHITHWAERQHHMMAHFFNNLKTYSTDPLKALPLYTHQTQVQVRLHFLSAVFSPLGSPQTFKLNLQQVDTLWECLAHDPECSDELFSWLLSQIKSSELHALGNAALKRLYIIHLPSLPPENFSMTCLSLFQQLCNLARIATANMEAHGQDGYVVGMDHMWKIALCANNTDVSMAAIQYLNSYYMGQNLQHEGQFVWQCMTHLDAATQDLISAKGSGAEEAPLLCIQRGLLLLKTHMETFRRRYAYHLRRWDLEGKGVGSHSALGDRSSVLIRLIIQPAGMSERCVLDLFNSDYIADLRAEVVTWWEKLCQLKNSETHSRSNNLVLLQEGIVRIITQGQELTTDCDEKTLAEMGFKDNQMIYIQIGAGRGIKKRDCMDSPSLQPPPPRESIPTLLLLKTNYFEQLFDLMHTLSSMTTTIKGGHEIPHTKAQVLSRRVWDILSLLPTNPTLLQGFQQLNMPLTELLDPSSPQKLMYSIYIVESLSIKTNCEKDMKGQELWSEVFIQQGGLRHLFDIFMSGILQQSADDGSEWQQDCLASLLKLLCHLGVEPILQEVRPSRPEKIIIPSLNEALLCMMNVKETMPRLTSILQEVSLPRDPNYYKTGFWGRAQVVHYAMALLVSWLHCSEEAKQALFQSSNFSIWLQRLVLEDPEPAVRREVCSALYRLCLGVSGRVDGVDSNLVAPMLSQLLNYLNVAEGMRPQKLEIIQAPEEGKEPYGPACRDYFWLISRLVDSLPSEIVKESLDEPNTCVVDLNSLTEKIALSILTRDYLETRHRTVDDDGLIGLLNLLTNLLKHHPPCQVSKLGQDWLCKIFDFLFELPNPKMRHVPKCKSARSRTAAFDLLVELVKNAPQNYAILHEKLLKQHQPGPNSPYPWDYWPHEDGRSECGYVGLTNLGATCYMASCMQHLYMMPQARASILSANTEHSKHEPTLKELQRMFAYLLESERKAYNPRSFCKVYTMDHQPLNTAEQKDMAEFFIDLVSKLEEMTPALKKVIKTLFCGVISNNVVSLDCDHVSRTLEEFYTVRCQVADMRNLYESLDEVTVKDTLEGDNMYTCSQCGKKVRAEKRACFKKLPHILCFNTMRYTFNMLTMLKEKVNTHFSFPLRLNMEGYVEKQLMPQQYQEEKLNSNDFEETEQYEYDLIGVTVHTGTADGGHYYSFIKDRTAGARDKWFLFNDAEVKPFDPNQIAAECFGGEMTSKTYDSVTDKFMDFSFEKTNSAYMLFYERCPKPSVPREGAECQSTALESDFNIISPASPTPTTFELSKELEDWIWEDNMHFIQDKNIFEHTYFNFIWQICGYIPQTISPIQPDITQKAAQLSTSFFIETFIHAKEKPTMVQWVELVTKQFNASQDACIWFLEHMVDDTWWPMQVLLKCPNQMVRQMFQRLCIHVIQRLKPSHSNLYLSVDSDPKEDKKMDAKEGSIKTELIGNASCVTKFVKTLLSLMEHGAKAHLKHLTEYFGFLYEFSRMGEEESKFLLVAGAINTMVHFYLGQKAHDFIDVSDGEEEEEIVSLPTDKYKPASLDKMITLIASLVEKSRDVDLKLRLCTKDYNAVAGGKGFPFLYQQIKDNINLQQTRNLIHSLCRGNERLATQIIEMISQAISRHSDSCQPFFKLLTLLTECGTQNIGGPSGLPCFTQLVLQRVWEAAESCPYSALDWLALQVTRSRLVHQWVLSCMDSWLEHFLMAHSNQRVRNAAAYLLVSLVPSTQFRQGFRASHRFREPHLNSDAQTILHQIYTALLRLLPAAKHYTDHQQHGTVKLTTYFALLMHCCVSRSEKLMFGQYFLQLWHLFHPKLSEPSIPAHHNKQALLAFWNHVCTDCPENIQHMLQNGHVTKNIAFNYILADHDDQEIVLFNRAMLPAYYGLLRMMCQQSRTFTRHLAQHQNLQWAFKNITPHPTQYPTAVEELFKLMQLFVTKHPDANETELREICSFRRSTLLAYLQCLDGRTSWGTLISAFRILVDCDDDRLYIVYNGGLQIVFESFQNLHVMLHEATACHVSGDLIEILSILLDIVRCVRSYRDPKDARGILLAYKDWLEVLRKLASLLNTYNPSEMRLLCIEILKEFISIMPGEVMQILVPLLSHCHSAFQDSHDSAVPLGPYFPRRGHQLPPSTGKGVARPLRPMVQMTVPHSQLECSRGVDPVYDEALDKFFTPYHEFIDMLCRLAVKSESLSEIVVTLSALVGVEAVPLHSTFFPKLWLDVLRVQHMDRKYSAMLTSSNYFVDYIDAILLDERSSLTVDIIYEFLIMFFPKVSAHVLSEQTLTMIDNTVVGLSEQVNSVDLKKTAKRLAGDIRALVLVYSSPEAVPPPLLTTTLQQLRERLRKEITALEPPLQLSPSTSQSDNNKSHGNKTDSDSAIVPSTSKAEGTSSQVEHHKIQNDSVDRNESDSETQNTSSSEDSIEEQKSQPSGQLENLKLLNSSIEALLNIVEKKG